MASQCGWPLSGRTACGIGQHAERRPPLLLSRLGMDLHWHGDLGVTEDALGGFGWALRATSSELHVCQVLRSGITRRPARRTRRATMRVRFPGLMGVPYFVVKTRPRGSCQSSPAAFRFAGCWA